MCSNKRPHFLYGLSACVVLLVWMCSGSPAWAEGKMGSRLDRAVKALGDTERLRTMPGVFYSSGEPHVKLFLKLSDVPPEIQKAGVELRVKSGNVYTARMPLAEVANLASVPQVIRMEAVRKLKPLLDVSVPDIAADEVWIKPRWGSQGGGVLVGMLDTGILYEHEAFQDEEGNSRVLYVWDNTTDTECDPLSIQDRSCRATDTVDGHGTAVMGVIAGAGSDECQGREACEGRGVAPRASIAVVKLDEWDEEELTEGVAYIFEKAAELGLPAVVNLSLGGFGGPLDGSSSAEEFISNQTGPGRIVVAAAGNEALRRAHAEASVSQGTEDSVSAFVARNVAPVGPLALGRGFRLVRFPARGFDRHRGQGLGRQHGGNGLGGIRRV